jgi:hypothetical protein
MASQAARQRKGALGAPRSGEALVQVANAIAVDAEIVSASLGGVPSSGNNGGLATSGMLNGSYHHRQNNHQPVIVATVKRNKYGTSPFDENWLNVDCCGLFCAAITYMLHMYGVYATCLILIPPWMSTVDELGVRTISFMGHVNRLAFTTVAVLAVYAHWKAMTTDPGAVPPDAIPLEPVKALLNGVDVENGNGTDGGQQQTSSLMQEDPLLAVTPPPPPRQGKRLCRRCNTYKPKRAHHCSICKRCIIKMDRKFARKAMMFESMCDEKMECLPVVGCPFCSFDFYNSLTCFAPRIFRKRRTQFSRFLMLDRVLSFQTTVPG